MYFFSNYLLFLLQGTTGNPKASVASHFNIVNNSYNIAKRLQLNKTYHRACLQAPLFHAMGSTIASMGPINVGGTIVLAGETYSPTQSLKTCAEEG